MKGNNYSGDLLEKFMNEKIVSFTSDDIYKLHDIFYMFSPPRMCKGLAIQMVLSSLSEN